MPRDLNHQTESGVGWDCQIANEITRDGRGLQGMILEGLGGASRPIWDTLEWNVRSEPGVTLCEIYKTTTHDAPIIESEVEG